MLASWAWIFFSPSDRARSRSTLVPVSVDRHSTKDGDCHETSDWWVKGRRQDFSKGGSHWVIQRVLTRLSPEYCGLFADKKAYKRGVTGTPGNPLATPLEYRQISQLSFITASKRIIRRGCEMRPTQRLVVARLHSRSLESGWSKDILRRGTRINVFPRTAVTVKKQFKTVINFSWPCDPAVKLAQQKVRTTTRSLSAGWSFVKQQSLDSR